MKRWFYFVLLGIGIFLGGYTFLSFPRTHLEKDFALYDLNNHLLHLSHFAGHPLIVCFFSPRCKDCKDTVPLLNELYETYRGKGLVIVGVGIKYPEEIREFVGTQGVRYPVVVDSNLAASRDFGVFLLPHIVFFNRQGKIVSTAAGKVAPEEFQKFLQAIL